MFPSNPVCGDYYIDSPNVTGPKRPWTGHIVAIGSGVLAAL